ncbi:protein piccolo-like, partial [Stegodyphus dumicola]|uniref:protein piccolo-like n=1 Tax=Stegodyphus dumicola TaxID=202533 RepID=UPI0015A826FB
EMEISDGEQPCSSFSNAYNSFSEKLDSNELTCNIPGSSMQTHCDHELKIKDDIKTKTVQETARSELSPIICIKTLSQTPDLAPETFVESKRHLLKFLPDKTVLDDKKSANTIDSSEGGSVHKKSESISAQNLISRTHTTDNQVLSSVNISNFVTSLVSESLNQVSISSCEPVLTSPKVSEHLQPPKNGTDHASKQDMKLCEEQNSLPSVNSEHSVSPGNRNFVVSDCLSITNNFSNQTVCGNVSSSVSDCVNIPVVIQANSHNSDNIEKAKETGESDLQPVVASSETSEPTRSSATQKRKVSLSEYRLRMRESINRVKGLETTQKRTSASKICATAIPEKLPEQVTLAPLPLFDTSVTPGSSPHSSSKSVKKKNEMVKSAEEETKNECIEYRGNLTERLKREFGFDDDLGGSTMPSLGQTKPVNNAKISSNQIIPSVQVCAQPPPPPPPPPPRPPRPNQTLLGGPVVASSPQFGFHVAPPYPQPPYIINQVPGAQYVPAQPALAVSAMPSVHPAGVQCTVRPPLLPSAHSFVSSVPSTVLRPPTQHEYASLNAQNYAALVHQPPPPPPQKAFPHVYQPGLYK